MKLSLDSPEAQRFRLTVEMAYLGIHFYRQRMRREHPGAGDEEIEARRWFHRGRALEADLDAPLQEGE